MIVIKEQGTRLKIIIIILLTLVSSLFSSENHYKKDKDNQQQYENYKCDGRKYCSQMTSCEEATYFIKNCPNTKMDGNRDGVPCERQWCNL